MFNDTTLYDTPDDTPDVTATTNWTQYALRIYEILRSHKYVDLDEDTLDRNYKEYYEPYKVV